MIPRFSSHQSIYCCTCIWDFYPHSEISTLPIICSGVSQVASCSPDFYHILPIYHEILKRRNKIAYLKYFYCDLSVKRSVLPCAILWCLTQSLHWTPPRCQNAWNATLKKIKFAEFPGGGYPPDPPLKAQGLGTCVSNFHFPSKGVGISATFINVQSQQVCFVFCFIDKNTRVTYYFCSFSYFRKSVCTVFL